VVEKYFQATSFSVPIAVFGILLCSGVGVIPHKIIFPIPKHSEVRNKEPTLKTERKLSQITVICFAFWRSNGSADIFPSPILRDIEPSFLKDPSR